MRRIVITGIGLVTSIGVGREMVWNRLLEGISGIRPVKSFGTSRYRVHVGGEIRDFDPSPYVRQADAGTLGRASQFAIVAGRLAIDDAGLDLDRCIPGSIGVSMGTTAGEPRIIESFDDCLVNAQPERTSSRFALTYPCHVIAGNLAKEFGFAGINVVIPAACAAGNHALAYAFDALRAGRADVMLAGGADAFSRITYTGFAQLGAIAPEKCQPFDRNRQGMIPGEGAAVLVLEPLQQAKQRNATVYAEIGGYGLSCDAHHMTGPDPQGTGAARAMSLALRNSGVNADDVDYISAHGTGTKMSDEIETKAVKHVFNGAAYRIPMSSIKSAIGHTMGAASAIEAAACALALTHDRIPPTTNWETPDPDCDLDYVVTGAREHRVEVAMNNAYAFGGNNASLVLKKYGG